MISTDTNFYEQLDIVFDKLYEKYGFEDNIIDYKQKLLKLYDLENEYRNHKINDMEVYVDENGYIKTKNKTLS
jgi:hypothetical protein